MSAASHAYAQGWRKTIRDAAWEAPPERDGGGSASTAGGVAEGNPNAAPPSDDASSAKEDMGENHVS